MEFSLLEAIELSNAQYDIVMNASCAMIVLMLIRSLVSLPMNGIKIINERIKRYFHPDRKLRGVIISIKKLLLFHRAGKIIYIHKDDAHVIISFVSFQSLPHRRYLLMSPNKHFRFYE